MEREIYRHIFTGKVNDVIQVTSEVLTETKAWFRREIHTLTRETV
jgi:hypothetical protein